MCNKKIPVNRKASNFLLTDRAYMGKNLVLPVDWNCCWRCSLSSITILQKVFFTTKTFVTFFFKRGLDSY